MVKAQEWLDKNYSKEKRSKIQEIHLNESNLEGEVDLGDFTELKRVCVSPQVDETKLVFKNLAKKVNIVKLVQVQQWLDQNYPKNGTCVRKSWQGGNHEEIGKKRSEITELLNINFFSKILLRGNLNLNDFINLRELVCDSNQLTSLDLVNCEQLGKVQCRDNSLTSITLPTNPANLKHLDLRNNNFSATQDLSFLTPYTNLEKLYLADNKFTGSLDYLSEMKQLRKLDISNTDLNEVNIDKLPKSLEEIEHSIFSGQRLNCKLTAIVPQLEKYITMCELNVRFSDLVP